MNVFCQQRVSVIMILATSLIGGENVGIGEEQEPTKMIEQSQEQIKSLDAIKTAREYYTEAGKIARNVIRRSTSSDQGMLAASLLESLLARSTTMPKTSTDDVFIMHKVASCLVTDTKVPVVNRLATAHLLSRYLGEVRREIIPNFQPRHVVENVSPPRGGGGGRAAGMDPEAIRDPTEKAMYMKAIKKNQENNLMNTRQLVLRNVEREMSMPVVDYMITVFRQPNTPESVVDECIKNAKLTAEETKKVEIAIGATRGKGNK